MWHAMFAEQIPLAEKILRTVIVYALIAVLFRLTGKRGLASLNTFDVVVIFLLSNVVQNAIIGNDTSLTGGIIGAVTLVAVNTGVNRLIAVSGTAARIFDGDATTVITGGHAVNRALRRLGMRRSELNTAVRLQNAGIPDVQPREPGAGGPARAHLEGRGAGRDQIRRRRTYRAPPPDREPAQRTQVTRKPSPHPATAGPGTRMTYQPGTSRAELPTRPRNPQITVGCVLADR